MIESVAGYSQLIIFDFQLSLKQSGSWILAPGCHHAPLFTLARCPALLGIATSYMLSRDCVMKSAAPFQGSHLFASYLYDMIER